MNDWLYASWINITNPYRMLYGEKKGGYLAISKKGKFWKVTHDDIPMFSPSPHCLGVRVKVFGERFEPVLKVEKGDAVMDVGASAGDTSILFAKKCAPGLLIAVEAEGLNAECLEYNLKDYNHEIINKAAWNKRDKLRFNINETVCGHSIAGAEGDTDCTEVEADTIDNMAAGRKIDFLKIDIQGAEIEGLEGAEEVLRKVKKVVVETHNVNGKSTCPDVVEYLKRKGFEVKTTPQITGCPEPDIVHAWH